MERLREEYPDLATPARCITCRGEGAFKWRSKADSTTYMTYVCNCIEQWALHVYLLHCGIDLSYQRLSWQDCEAEPAAVDLVQRYLEHADDYVSAGCGLVLHGEMGAGKTMLASLLLKSLIAKGIDGYFVPFWRMIEQFTAGWRDEDQRAWFRRRVENAGVLVLDDVGKEYMQKRVDGGSLKDFATTVVGSTFDAVLRHRVAASKPTIITTNFDLVELRQSYGSNIFSLLEERSAAHRFTGESYRAKSRMRFNDEIDAGLRRPVVIG